MAADDPAEQYWEKLRELMEQSGWRKVVELIQGIANPEERRSVYAFAQRAFGQRDWKGKNLNDQIYVVRAGIADSAWQAAEAAESGDAELARACKDKANVMSYNLAADLAECWPGDAVPREREHFEAGLRAAHDCVLWRHELGKPPERRAMAYWAVGMHQLSLGHRIEALGAFQIALGLAAEALSGGADPAKPGTPAGPEPFAAAEVHVKPGGDFSAILYSGYTGIARRALGAPEGARQLERACSAFEKTIQDFPEMEEDARIGLEQLRWVERKIDERARV